ncbi:MAG: YicC/YloC family endoribonuclease [Clostridium sp.]
MIKSMTGFGRCEIVTAECKISVEMKAVNHRYLDLSIKLPKKFNYFEAGIRNLLKTYIHRVKGRCIHQLRRLHRREDVLKV